ncbi:serine hydrolase domain-containing protein [Yinghuangia sp. YIM S10712]|uniref:serine hydrolase domain-containing protein n=1 Tax=Yinghuangia sp. YIM S10712 TaxID=3436930 RepID=UPI003F537450
MTDLAALARNTADRIARSHVGIVVAVVAGDTAEIRGAGRVGAADSDSDSPGAETLFEIGSVTKVFTALALARLVAAGAVGLDEPLADLLPPGTHVPSRDGCHIKPEHLATHTSGLPRLPKGMLAKAILRPSTPDPYAGCTADMLLRGLEKTKLGATPGRRYRYSNLGGGLLGLALAERAGLDYESLVRREILDPLDMHDTVITIDGQRSRRFAQGHSRRGKPVPPWNLVDLAGAGGLRSTAADLAAFVRAQLRSDDGVLADAVRLSRETEFAVGPYMRSHLGWISTPVRDKDHRRFWHNGRTGGFSSFVGLTPDQGVGVVLLANSGRSLDRPALELLERLETALS